jgi:prophage antirepressor-like protein
MNNAIQMLTYETKPCRMTLIEGEPWWVAKDVCDILEISKHRDAISRLDSDERGSVVVDTLGGSQTMSAVNESGLYSLIFDSRKPEAKKFKRWVTHEVLPQLRRTGMFMMSGELPPEIAEIMSLEYRLAALKKRLEARELDCKAKLVYRLDGAVPIVDWLRERYPNLNDRQLANESRSIKRALSLRLHRPIGAQRATAGNGNKVIAALPCDIEAAVALLKTTRKELN